MILVCGHEANATSNGTPSCAICDTTEVATQPDLTGRIARCAYGCGSERPSTAPHLAFFEYRGPGSRYHLGHCACGYTLGAHDPAEMCRTVSGKTVIEDGRCKYGKVTPRDPAEFDSYYCGCRGWD